MAKPLALVVTEPENDSEHVFTALKSCGWDTFELNFGEVFPDGNLPTILILDLRGTARQLDLSEGFSTQSWSKSIPRLALSLSKQSLAGFDRVIDPSENIERLKEIFAEWRPPDALDALDRIAGTLGAAAVAPIVTGLKAELGNAVAELDAGRTDAAHRIAGLAGTLGFHSVSTVWNALSHGDMTLYDAARREARVAMASIDRWLIDAGRL